MVWCFALMFADNISSKDRFIIIETLTAAAVELASLPQTSSKSTSSTSSAATSSSSPPATLSASQREEIAQLKAIIESKYAVNNDKENVTHRPTVKYGQDPKKKVRYLNNQVWELSRPPLVGFVFIVVGLIWLVSGCFHSRREVHLCQDRSGRWNGEEDGEYLCAPGHSIYQRQTWCLILFPRHATCLFVNSNKIWSFYDFIISWPHHQAAAFALRMWTMAGWPVLFTVSDTHATASRTACFLSEELSHMKILWTSPTGWDNGDCSCSWG